MAVVVVLSCIFSSDLGQSLRVLCQPLPKSMRKMTTLTKLCRPSPTGAGYLGRVICQWHPYFWFSHRGLFSLGGDSKVTNCCHREINKSESSKSPIALDSCLAFLSVTGRCRVCAPQLMWLDLDVDQSDGEGKRETAAMSGMHLNSFTHSTKTKLKAYLGVGWRGSEAELLDISE